MVLLAVVPRICDCWIYTARSQRGLLVWRRRNFCLLTFILESTIFIFLEGFAFFTTINSPALRIKPLKATVFHFIFGARVWDVKGLGTFISVALDGRKFSGLLERTSGVLLELDWANWPMAARKKTLIPSTSSVLIYRERWKCCYNITHGSWADH